MTVTPDLPAVLPAPPAVRGNAPPAGEPWHVPDHQEAWTDPVSPDGGPLVAPVDPLVAVVVAPVVPEALSAVSPP
jgi:hypothetical protein